MRHWQLLFTLALASAAALADVKPLPRAQWPTNAAQAVPLIVGALQPAQKSIVRATSRDSLFLLQGEWGEDIETLLGLNDGNGALVSAVCARACPVHEATLLLMEAAWEAVAKEH